MSGFLVAVDYGTVNTAAMLGHPDGQVRPVLFDGSPLLPSAACLGPDGRLLVGRDAETAGRVDPAAFVPDPRSRIDVGTVAVGAATFPVVDVITATLGTVCQEAVRSAGGVRPRLILTHPAVWDERLRATLTEAGSRTGLGVPALVPAPVAAGWYQTQSAGDLAPGQHLLMYHLGAGSFEASLVRRSITGYEVIAAAGLPDVGGVDLDDLLVRIVGAAIPAQATPVWQRLVSPNGAADLRRFMHLYDDARAAKEALSRQSVAGIHIPLLDQNVQVSREAFESAAEPVLARTVELTAELLTSTGTAKDRVGALLLLGGSSRIPLVRTLLHRRLGLAPVTCKQPELAVVEGALIAATRRYPAAGSGPVTAADERPTQELKPVPVPAAQSATMPTTTVAVSSPSRRRSARVLTAGAVAVCAVAAGATWYVLQPNRPVASGRLPASATTPSSLDPRPQVANGGPASRSRSGPAPGPSQSPSPSSATTSTPPVSAPPSSPPSSAGDTPVQVSLAAAPDSGICATNFNFAAHFTISGGQHYRWHWVFGGSNNYSSIGGDQMIDKTGDVHTTKKFDASGTYWAQIQITSPVTSTSGQVTVQVTCGR